MPRFMEEMAQQQRGLCTVHTLRGVMGCGSWERTEEFLTLSPMRVSRCSGAICCAVRRSVCTVPHAYASPRPLVCCRGEAGGQEER